MLLKALLPDCMKYTARGESRVANIVLGKAECYICHETLTKELHTFIQTKWQCFKCFIVF